MAKFWQSVEAIVMTDIQRAMLGDHEAAARLTEQGVLIPCPWCGKTPEDDDLIGHWKGYTIYHQCKQVGPMRTNGKTRYKACLAWNTRAPLLTPEQINMIERMENK